MDKVLDCIQATAVKEYTEKKTSAACGRRENSSSLSQTSNADGPPDLLFIFLTNKTTTTTRVNEPFKQSTHLAREAVFLSRLEFIIDLCLVEFGEYQHTRADREHKRRQKGLGGEREAIFRGKERSCPSLVSALHSVYINTTRYERRRLRRSKKKKKESVRPRAKGRCKAYLTISTLSLLSEIAFLRLATQGMRSPWKPSSLFRLCEQKLFLSPSPQRDFHHLRVILVQALVNIPPSLSIVLGCSFGRAPTTARVPSGSKKK